MRNKRGIELALSTIVIVVIVILVLIGLVYLITNGFSMFRGATQPFLDTAEATSVREACKVACTNEDTTTFCGKKYAIDSKEYECRQVYELYKLPACKLSC